MGTAELIFEHVLSTEELKKEFIEIVNQTSDFKLDPEQKHHPSIISQIFIMTNNETLSLKNFKGIFFGLLVKNGAIIYFLPLLFFWIFKKRKKQKYINDHIIKKKLRKSHLL